MTNVFFNNFQSSMEQDLIEDLTIESIGIFGHSIYYCPRTVVAKDDVFGEDARSEYNSAYQFDLYIRSYDQYEGDGTFLSKFNLEIRDQVKFSIARRTFHNEVGSVEKIERPREGDLIYSPMMKRMFIIAYANQTPVFYQLGALQTWDVTCEVFEYSSEKINTGIYEIDEIENRYSMDENAFTFETDGDNPLTDDEGYPISTGQFDFEEQNQDTFADNQEFQEESTGIIDWSQINPFNEA